MRLRTVLTCLMLWPILALAQDRTFTLNDLGWLSGCWTSNRNDRAITEHWLRPEGGTMFGISRTIANGKTVEFEFMQIREAANGQVLFIAKPSGQPETTFKLIRGGATEAVFEDAQHDFPQRVIYRLQSDGSLMGRIEGTIKGKEKSVDFPMGRAQCDK